MKNVIRLQVQLFGYNNWLCRLFRTELETDDFFDINIRSDLLVNYFAVGLFPLYGLHGIAAFG